MASDDHHPSDLADRFQVRMPPGMRERIADEARANNRSMNSEIVQRIASSFEQDRSENTDELNPVVQQTIANGFLMALLSVNDALDKIDHDGKELAKSALRQAIDEVNMKYFRQIYGLAVDGSEDHLASGPLPEGRARKRA